MRSERGYTVIEAMIVCVLLIAMLGATLSLLDTTANVAPQENERAHAVRDAQVQLAGMVRELRQAHEVYFISADRIEVQVPLVGGELRRVEYECTFDGSKPDTKSCKRRLYNAAGTTVERTSTAVDRLLVPAGQTNPTVFTWTSENGKVVFVKARIAVPASGERKEGLKHEIVLDDGFLLRNLNK